MTGASGKVVAYRCTADDLRGQWVDGPPPAYLVGLNVTLELAYAAPAAPPVREMDEAAALAEFTEYFARNYPGPNTIICDPKWHAPKLFRAALRAITTATPPSSAAGEDYTPGDFGMPVGGTSHGRRP